MTLKKITMINFVVLIIIYNNNKPYYPITRERVRVNFVKIY